MILAITAGKTVGNGVPLVRNMQLKSTATTVIIGSVLKYTAGELDLASTGPTTGIVGIAAQAYNTAPGFAQMNTPTVNTGRRANISFYAANPGQTIFVSKLTNNSATYIAPVLADIGVNIGLTLQSSGIWTADKNITGGNACITPVEIDIDNLLIYWVFMAAAVV